MLVIIKLILVISRLYFNGTETTKYFRSINQSFLENNTPIVLVHGILSNANAMIPVKNKLKELYP